MKNNLKFQVRSKTSAKVELNCKSWNVRGVGVCVNMI